MSKYKHTERQGYKNMLIWWLKEKGDSFTLDDLIHWSMVAWDSGFDIGYQDGLHLISKQETRDDEKEVKNENISYNKKQG